jgi:hypothetical protein
MSKVYKSIFVPEVQIDVANYLCELMMRNYMDWQKIPYPKCPFWRAEFASQSKLLKQLSERYVIELGGIQELLMVFSPDVIANLFTTKKVAGFKLFKAETKDRYLWELYCDQVKLVKSLLKAGSVKKEELVLSDDKNKVLRTFVNTGTKSLLGM